MIMRTTEAVKTHSEWDHRGRIVFTPFDLQKTSQHRSDKTPPESLRRLVFNGLLERASNGVYVNPLSNRSRADLLVDVALALRRGECSNLGLECALSEWGLISQVPQSYLTAMTAGRRGTFCTWRVDIETQPGRRNMPKQKIRLDVENAPSPTRELHEIARNHDVLPDLEAFVHVRNREEILAGRLVAFSWFVINRNRQHPRDVWDIRWHAGNGVKVRADLVCSRAQGHCAFQVLVGIRVGDGGRHCPIAGIHRRDAAVSCSEDCRAPIRQSAIRGVPGRRNRTPCSQCGKISAGRGCASSDQRSQGIGGHA